MTPSDRNPLKPLPRWIFASRWLQAPLYIGLIVAQAVSTPVSWDELTEISDPRDFNLQTVPTRLADLGDPQSAIDDVAHSLDTLLEWWERDLRDGLGEMPYPPDYPKMPDEPKRVQPSKARDRA
jgi:hypothetical protein